MYKNKDKDRLIESILAIIEKAQSQDIIYFWEDEKIRVNTKYLKFFSKNSAVEEYDELNKRSFATWLKEELDNNGLKMDSTPQKLLAEKKLTTTQRDAQMK